MEINERYRRNVRIFYGWLGSTLIFAGSQIAGSWLIDFETTVSRAAGVAIGVLGMLPWMAVVAIMVRRGDEYERRMHLVAIAIAASVGLVLVVTLAWLVRAWFIEPPDLMFVWLACLVVWFIAIMGTKRYFERAQ